MAAGRKRDPRERAEDGAARDPAAFQQSIRDDPGLMAELEGNPEAQKVLLGGDLNAMQDYLRSMHRVRETSPRPSCPPSPLPARARAAPLPFGRRWQFRGARGALPCVCVWREADSGWARAEGVGERGP